MPDLILIKRGTAIQYVFRPRAGTVRLALHASTPATLDFIADAYVGGDNLPSVPELGDEVGVWDNGQRLFGGLIYTVEQSVFSRIPISSNTQYSYFCNCSGWERRLDQNLIIPPSTSGDPSTFYRTLTGQCDVSGVTVTLDSGDRFDANMVGTYITIGGSSYLVASFISYTSITLTTSASHTNAAWTWEATGTNVIRSLITNFAGNEGFVPGYLNDDTSVPPIDKIVFNYTRVSDAIREVIERTALRFLITPDKEYRAFPHGDLALPDQYNQQISPSSVLRDRAKKKNSLDDMVNRMYRGVSWDSIPPTTESFTGNGSLQNFYLSNPAESIDKGEILEDGKEPIEVQWGNGDAVDPGKDFYWRPGERAISQPTAISRTVNNATNATPIEITTTVDHGFYENQLVVVSGVTGNTAANGTFRISLVDNNSFTLRGSAGNGVYVSGGTAVVNDELTSAQELRITYKPLGGNVFGNAEGGETSISNFGIFANFSQSDETKKSEEAIDYANRYVANFSEFREELTLASIAGLPGGVDPRRYILGQIVTYNDPPPNGIFNLPPPANYGIQEIEVTDNGRWFEYTFALVDGTRVRGWREYFIELARRKGGGGAGITGGSNAAALGLDNNYFSFGFPATSAVVGPATDAANHALCPSRVTYPRYVLVQKKDWTLTTQLRIDIRVASSTGITFTSIFPSGSHPFIDSPSLTTLVHTSFESGASFPANGQVRIDIESGSAAGVNVVVVTGP